MHWRLLFRQRADVCPPSCRLMSGPVFLLPPMKETHRFFVRLDADSHVTRPVTKRTDALIAAAEGGQVYVFWSVAVESCRWHYALLICSRNLIFHFVFRWLGHNCSHMHDIARSHLLAGGADFDTSLYSLFRRQVSLNVRLSLMLTCCRCLRMTLCVGYIFKQISRLCT